MVAEAKDYKWSSFHEYVNCAENSHSIPRLLSKEERSLVMSFFGNDEDKFSLFNHIPDTTEFLDIKEDIEQNRNQATQQIIEEFAQRLILRI